MDAVVLQRIERLIKDLEYECAKGIHQDEIDESIGFEKYIGHFSENTPAWRLKISFEPISKYDFLATNPRHLYEGLRLVIGGKEKTSNV